MAVLSVLESEGGPGFDLYPFPFWSDVRSLADQFRFHGNFMSGTVLLCGQLERTASFRGRAVLRAAHEKEETHCAVRVGDSELVRRCRSWKRLQFFPGMRGWATSAGKAPAAVPSQSPAEEWLENFRCPTAEEEDAFFSLRPKAWRERSAVAAEKYGVRSQGSRKQSGLGCEEPASEWRVDLRPLHKCVFVVIMERLRLPPGSLVLDWGAGCGHKLTWAAQLYDLRGVGIDIVPENIRWAQEHSVGHFCQMDGRFLTWIPDDTFDALISYAALMHLESDDQCDTVVTLVEKVRIGGRLWFGWNAPMIRSIEDMNQMPERNPEFWHDCFALASAQKATG
ncbi:NMT3 [Symbiodinium natans]|uniref:NMT3 protein n=1 Tax=Symbiodinium natans TaxID=878477 RepID=A0A812G6D0_9DINO|nr:NMT3 [Symbiodinium natans]